MPRLKHSRQRDAIQDFISHSCDHPSADTVYLNVRKTFPNISLGTVYRNLSLLTDLGEIRKISMADGADRFDAVVAPHDHFVCEECHCLFDIAVDDKESITAYAQQHFDGEIRAHSTIFYGTCRACLDKKNSQTDEAKSLDENPET